ncbi:hypothetical protein [Lacrimispora sp.]|uniref:hypothetical protein n=1 Tax=Lacrimispora sp. TaxID=2719234 RepID=UPI0032E3A299
MADISQEINDFQNAVYGEEVRGSLISLAEKVNEEVEENTTTAMEAAAAANTAAGTANTAAGAANIAAGNANDAAESAAETRQDILNRLAEGEFKGEKGDTGNTGPQGQSGISIPPSSRMYVYTDDANNSAIHCVYDDALYDAPPIQYNDVTGAMYWTYDNGQ